MEIKKPKASDFIELKNQIKNELLQRRIYKPNLSSFAKEYEDYNVNEPTEKGLIKAEHINIIIDQINQMRNSHTTATSHQTKISLGDLKTIVDGYTAKEIYSKENDCSTGGCAGMCVDECGNTCSSGCVGSCGDGCTGSCSESCKGDCVTGCSSCGGSCSNNCSANCGDGCQGCSAACKNNCTGKCKTTCTGECKNTCYQCSHSCSTGCAKACTTGCYGTCKGCTGCSRTCSGSCGSSCWVGAVDGA